MTKANIKSDFDVKYGLTPSPGAQWKKKSYEAALKERQGDYKNASILWLEAAELTSVSLDIEWCRGRAAWCKHQSKPDDDKIEE